MILFNAPVTVLLSEVNNDPILLIAGALTTFVTDTVSIPSRSVAAATAKPGVRRAIRSPNGRIIIPADAPIVAAAGAEGTGGRKAGGLNGGGTTGGRGARCVAAC